MFKRYWKLVLACLSAALVGGAMSLVALATNLLPSSITIDATATILSALGVMISALGVILTALAIGLAVVGVFGLRAMSDKVADTTNEYLDKELGPDGALTKAVERRVAQRMYEGVEPVGRRSVSKEVEEEEN